MARVLLVEDDLDVRPLLEHILLTDPQYEVTAVESVANATALLATQPFDLVVTDVNLPDGSGLRIADRAKEKGIRTLVITAYGLSLNPGDLASYDYLLKPLRVHELLDAVRRALAPGASQ
ncbi:MAG TPA: response regulator, partial [Stellaceae bacterium]|nr:response regulator [Stellaceae bacterium]